MRPPWRRDDELSSTDIGYLTASDGERAASGAADIGVVIARFRRALRRGGFSRNESYLMSQKLFDQLLADMQDD